MLPAHSGHPCKRAAKYLYNGLFRQTERLPESPFESKMTPEEFNPNVYQIPCKFTNRYKGAGYAVAAIDENDRLVDFFYISDYIPEFGVDDRAAPETLPTSIIADPRLAVPVSFLTGKGEIAFGRMDSWEFVVL